ncbi:hypothetical protein HOY80DRAFT_930306 [Tuber brumale]|nr:hypothetical protein HOY80DRAFT_930306 [Tuber brumale]
MSYRRIRSKAFDTAKPSPDGDSARESTEDSKDEPLKRFSSDDQPHRDHISLARGFSITFLALVLLMICLWTFSKKHPMSKWEQRSFNTLSILLTAIASLGLGSILGHLGSMLRWPLLARTVYKMQDVDSILGMSPPVGSLRLISRHIRERRVSRTTFIVTAYLVTNVIGRLSVAIFGLSYNMPDKTGIEYPILATNWTSALWTGQIFSNGTGDTGRSRHESREGKETAPQTSIGDDISAYLPSDLVVSNTTLNLARKSTVEYSYNLKDFKEGYAIPLNHTVHSSVNCSIIEVGEGQYWRWDNGNRTGPFNWGEGDSADVVSGILRVSNETEVLPYTVTRWTSFLDSVGGSNVYPQIYILCENIAWECWPTLTETAGDNESGQIQPHEKFFHSTDLYRLLTAGRNIYDASTVGDSNQQSAPGSDNLGPQSHVYITGFGGSPAGAEADNGVLYFCNNRIFESQNEMVLDGYRLWMASLVARLPIVAIMHANTALPKFARGPYPSKTAGTAYIHTTLEVEWFRVALIAISITGGQILAILAVLCYCTGVYTRDDSHLATAELLKTVITRFDDGKLMTGEELAASLDDVLKESVSYGTRKGRDGGPPEVDLASDLDANFPPFPQKKPSTVYKILESLWWIH